MQLIKLTNINTRHLLNEGQTQKDFPVKEIRDDVPSKGLMARITLNGITIVYRYSFAGQNRKHRLGFIPHGKVTDKRLNAIETDYDKAVDQVAQGIDIAGDVIKKKETIKKKADEKKNEWTLAALCSEYELKGLSGGEDHRKATKRDLHNHILPGLGESKPIKDIKHWDLQELVNDINETHYRAASKVAGTLRRLFKFGVKRGKLDFNVAIDLDSEGARERQRVLDDNEIRLIWNQLDETCTEKVADSLRIDFYLGARIGEVSQFKASMIHDEFRGNPDENGSWLKLRKELTKSGKQAKSQQKKSVDYWFFLTPSVKALLKNQDFVLATRDELSRGITDCAVAAGILLKNDPDSEDFEPTTDPQPQAHDLRRTFATRVEAKYGKDRSDQVLNHAKTGLSKNYHQYGYDKEKCQTSVWWESELNRILGKSDHKSNVIQLSA